MRRAERDGSTLATVQFANSRTLTFRGPAFDPLVQGLLRSGKMYQPGQRQQAVDSELPLNRIVSNRDTIPRGEVIKPQRTSPNRTSENTQD